ncbi:MAG TPA: glycosyltransferase family 4 protein [Candidatus Baltobacteraceae bacterium]|nr:glycosyltransferase family 4 protein [Candidatus Baltobacteraceae bacterium]
MESITQIKVAHLTSVHRPSDTRIAHRECATLSDAGYDVVLIAPGSGRGVPRGVRFRGVDPPANRFDRVTRTMYRVYRVALAERADIYHFHDPELMLLGLMLRMRGKEVIFDVHEDIPRDILDKPWIPRVLRRPTSIAAKAVLRVLQRGYSGIVAATPAIAEHYSHPRKVVVANYPCVEELAGKAQRPIAEREKCVVYVGEITALRGAAEMVNGAGALRGAVRLLLVGPFEDPAVRERVRKLPGWKYVDYLGPRHRSDLPDLLSTARAGLLLMLPAENHYDALPTKVFEYMAAGLPVIVSDAVPLSANIVREHQCGLVVDPRDEEAVANAIRFMMEHPDEAQAMGERGRAAALRQYQWESEGTKLTQLYAQIA